MSRFLKISGALTIALALHSPVGVAEPVGGEHWELAQRARRDGEVPDLAPMERMRASRLFATLAHEAKQGEITDATRVLARQLGLFSRLEGDLLTIWGEREPHGLFVLRVGAAPDLVIQAPHSFYDLRSGEIAAELFARSGARALFFNSAHRFGGPGDAGEPEAENPPDVAHRPYSLFQAASYGMLLGLERPEVVQVHGYRSRDGEHAVVSRGRALQSSKAVEEVIELLAEHELQGVTGREMSELAGRKNVQGMLIGDRGTFLHLELSREARDLMMERDELLDDLAELLRDRAGGDR